MMLLLSIVAITILPAFRVAFHVPEISERFPCHSAQRRLVSLNVVNTVSVEDVEDVFVHTLYDGLACRHKQKLDIIYDIVRLWSDY